MPPRNSRPTDLVASFSAALRAARAERAESQAAFAATLGVATGLVSMWERGQRAPSLDMVMAVAKKLGVDPVVLLGGEVR